MFVLRALHSCEYVFLRDDTVRAPLHLPFTGLYKIMKCSQNNMDILINDCVITMSLNRVKPAFFEPSLASSVGDSSSPSPSLVSRDSISTRAPQSGTDSPRCAHSSSTGSADVNSRHSFYGFFHRRSHSRDLD